MAVSATGFEGFEKRLEISFFETTDFLDPQGKSLRSLTKSQLDEILTPAECTIVSSLTNSFVDSYVLSESSLFVYPYKIIIKTCGTTKLLLSIPHILRLADSLCLTVKSVRYTRGSFIFPGAQSYPHRSFSEEVALLDDYFGKLNAGSKAFVMGGSDNNPQRWHVYSASSTEESAVCDKPVYTLEMCMTGLDNIKASVFFKTNSVSASEMTISSGIRNILPGSEICDFNFEPCGYSMNSIEGDAVSTIHVTPEDGFSYASFETVGYDLKALNFKELVDRVLVCFGPEEFSVAVHANLGTEVLASDCVADVNGYFSQERELEELGLGGSVLYQRFVKTVECCSPKSTLGFC
ncbi:S-adenosylmethionine decarboxylase [Arabidopsis thaliana]|jgi:S-adenosylmethionine decarboxylase|uniref:S-adenosylmethionine decarboxylase proenzyme 3 n=2 Tax=Arabidopsis thaliana TaxID=3702 RepID=DCAM3_ARATH|nr:Adenosylmethionine decarboxylase family protein [Arabidopsis thaliana]NP_189184.1 Adenosylmethionine decarboxylase family protein [Arabidopsis thaliana]Q9LSU6.1 RecName: Full=S-adenosylmethionine decarboxylase proenzyme 3; Short=AdoMetDC3; Contains: RecName: Full=S-adenosylmethionine decarboxylase 1 alpha chain; Contains: RecName: Full=S-adenosylmethionine decarboxylase 1 beta chain [Arabidopsis thaliana]AAT06473.1 At3g25570 [Arabidopsis thaliana]AEE77029.1 Adenosylmethionine decarboxylase f|eukprot:NP_001189972.1 Adenosylmethionine decarboxylase family protein [Arabidopsis thaliana]